MGTTRRTFSSAVLCLLQAYTIVNAQSTAPAVSVYTNLGEIAGIKDTFTNSGGQFEVHKYLGIPYAQPPVGSLRLQYPQPLTYLDSNPYDASYFRPHCIQADQEMHSTEDEDCLYLNVYVPAEPADQGSGHAVMIWVYGGGFITGTSNLYDSTLLAAVGNVIVVTINYRLGFFGFFSTKDSASPGNYGLYDQAMAFQWVHDNIASFGGDNSRVTIFGESAGAMSVHMQSLFSENYGRFQRVISQSGMASTPFIDVERDLSYVVMTISERFGCPNTYTYDLVECLRQHSWSNIKYELNQITLEHPEFQQSAFLPVLDGYMVKTTYQHIEDKWELYDGIEFFKSLDFLGGINMYDGGEAMLILQSMLGDVTYFMPTKDDMMHIYYDHFLAMGKDMLPDYIKTTILHEYTNWTDPTSYETVRVQFIKMLTDYFYTAPLAEALHLHTGDTASAHTFAYVFKPVTSSRMPWTPDWLPGADHAEELRSVFGFYFDYMEDWEQTLAVQIMTYWTNFAKSGNPNTPATVSVPWSMFDATHQAYIQLDKNMSADHATGHYMAAREKHFWHEVYAGLQKAMKDPYTCNTSGSTSLLVSLPLVLTSMMLLKVTT